MSSLVDEVAEAIYSSRPRRIPWEDLSEIGWKTEYRKMAESAIETMVLAEWRKGDYYPLPCAQCGRKMLRTESRAIYPHDGMICQSCADAFLAGE